MVKLGIIRICEAEGHGKFNSLSCPKCGKSGKICNHVTLIKLLFNPWLRKFFGYHIVSVFSEKDCFLGYQLRKNEKWR